jgi:hypothetical protein
MSSLIVAALAGPGTEQITSLVTVRSKEAILCVDASESMGRGERGSTMERIKVMLLDFAERRMDKGDFIGISTYSGPTNSSRGYGYARIIQYPSRDREIVFAAINSVRPAMFGQYSAVGDGIMVSIIALVEPKARQALGERYDRLKLEDAIWSVGTESEDLGYAQEIAEAVGKQRGRYIVLFTDGKFNTGLNPARAIWFTERIGLKVHFIAFESSAATGLSIEEQRKRKAQTIDAVLRTGGTYKESVDIEGVALFFQEIDRAEKVEIVTEEHKRTESRREIFTFGASAVFGIWMIGWIFWSDPL